MAGPYRAIYAFAREIHPKTVKKDIQYGTAGFRTKGSDLGYVLFRMGLLATLRARYKKATIGLMITASHNPETDNGVKLVDPMGEMLEQSWEKLATRMANVSDDQLAQLVGEIVSDYEIDMNGHASVFIGKDTRPSSVKLCKAATDGVVTLKGKPIDFGIVTTPMLHYFVVCRNTEGAYGRPSEEGYLDKLCSAFRSLRGPNRDNGNYRARLLFDGANGVGAKKIGAFKERLANYITFEDYNNAVIGSGQLNHLCGADYVKVQQTSPNGLPVEPNARCVSVDGDADRIVYFYTDDENRFHLLDGDRIATLIAAYITELLREANVDVTLGLVQTAYANGASTNYITNEMNIPVACVSTGVKHLHHKALEYDIGVYFEANGHGTVVFSQKTKDCIKMAAKDDGSRTAEQRAAAERLLTLVNVVNETVGDAFSDMLLVETVLHARGWDLPRWETTYTDLPNRQLKITVQDRNVITTTDAERVCVTPEGLQDDINAFVQEYSQGRAFVRPSGTEDVVRVYAEAATRQECDALAYKVASAVYERAGGVGTPPSLPN